jgi:hypothetical protein
MLDIQRPLAKSPYEESLITQLTLQQMQGWKIHPITIPHDVSPAITPQHRPITLRMPFILTKEFVDIKMDVFSLCVEKDLPICGKIFGIVPVMMTLVQHLDQKSSFAVAFVDITFDAAAATFMPRPLSYFLKCSEYAGNCNPIIPSNELLALLHTPPKEASLIGSMDRAVAASTLVNIAQIDAVRIILASPAKLFQISKRWCADLFSGNSPSQPATIPPQTQKMILHKPSPQQISWIPIVGEPIIVPYIPQTAQPLKAATPLKTVAYYPTTSISQSPLNNVILPPPAKSNFPNLSFDLSGKNGGSLQIMQRVYSNDALDIHLGGEIQGLEHLFKAIVLGKSEKTLYIEHFGDSYKIEISWHHSIRELKVFVSNESSPKKDSAHAYVKLRWFQGLNDIAMSKCTEEAQKMLNELIQKKFTRFDTVFKKTLNKGVYPLAQKRLNATSMPKELSQKYQDDLATHVVIAIRKLYKNNDFTKARTLLNDATKAGNHWKLERENFYLLIHEGKLKEALAINQQFIKDYETLLSPSEKLKLEYSSIEIKFWIDLDLAQNNDPNALARLQQLRKDYENILSQDSTLQDSVAERIADICNQIGRKHAEEYCSKEAEAAFKEALKHYPNHIPSHWNLMNLYARQGALGKAIEALEVLQALPIEKTQLEEFKQFSTTLKLEQTFQQYNPIAFEISRGLHQYLHQNQTSHFTNASLRTLLAIHDFQPKYFIAFIGKYAHSDIGVQKAAHQFVFGMLESFWKDPSKLYSSAVSKCKSATLEGCVDSANKTHIFLAGRIFSALRTLNIGNNNPHFHTLCETANCAQKLTVGYEFIQDLEIFSCTKALRNKNFLSTYSAIFNPLKWNFARARENQSLFSISSAIFTPWIIGSLEKKHDKMFHAERQPETIIAILRKDCIGPLTNIAVNRVVLTKLAFAELLSPLAWAAGLQVVIGLASGSYENKAKAGKLTNARNFLLQDHNTKQAEKRYRDLAEHNQELPFFTRLTQLKANHAPDFSDFKFVASKGRDQVNAEFATNLLCDALDTIRTAKEALKTYKAFPITNERADLQDYLLLDCGANGDCMFHAVAAALPPKNPKIQPLDLRQQAVDTLNKSSDALDKITLEDFCQSIGLPTPINAASISEQHKKCLIGLTTKIGLTTEKILPEECIGAINAIKDQTLAQAQTALQKIINRYYAKLYLAKLSEPGTWADHHCLAALAKRHHVHFEVFHSKGARYTQCIPEDGIGTRIRLYYDENHYQLLLRKTDYAGFETFFKPPRFTREQLATCLQKIGTAELTVPEMKQYLAAILAISGLKIEALKQAGFCAKSLFLLENGALNHWLNTLHRISKLSFSPEEQIGKANVHVRYAYQLLQIGYANLAEVYFSQAEQALILTYNNRQANRSLWECWGESFGIVSEDDDTAKIKDSIKQIQKQIEMAQNHSKKRNDMARSNGLSHFCHLDVEDNLSMPIILGLNFVFRAEGSEQRTAAEMQQLLMHAQKDNNHNICALISNDQQGNTNHRAVQQNLDEQHIIQELITILLYLCENMHQTSSPLLGNFHSHHLQGYSSNTRHLSNSIIFKSFSHLLQGDCSAISQESILRWFSSYASDNTNLGDQQSRNFILTTSSPLKQIEICLAGMLSFVCLVNRTQSYPHEVYIMDKIQLYSYCPPSKREIISRMLTFCPLLEERHAVLLFEMYEPYHAKEVLTILRTLSAEPFPRQAGQSEDIMRLYILSHWGKTIRKVRLNPQQQQRKAQELRALLSTGRDYSAMIRLLNRGTDPSVLNIKNNQDENIQKLLIIFSGNTLHPIDQAQPSRSWMHSFLPGVFNFIKDFIIGYLCKELPDSACVETQMSPLSAAQCKPKEPLAALTSSHAPPSLPSTLRKRIIRNERLL